MRSARKIAQEWWDSPPNESATGEEIEAVAKLIEDAREEAFEAAAQVAVRSAAKYDASGGWQFCMAVASDIRALAKGTL